MVKLHIISAEIELSGFHFLFLYEIDPLTKNGVQVMLESHLNFLTGFLAKESACSGEHFADDI